MTDFADFELSLHRRDSASYSVETRFTQPGSDADTRAAQPMSATFDLPTLQGMIADPVEYGKMLAESLFADANVLAEFSKARVSAQSQQAPLRVRLLIGPSAPELNALYWEALRDPQDKSPLFTNEQILFSRYLSSNDWRPVKLRPQGNLKALSAASNPSDLENYKLATVDVAGELSRAKEALGTIPISELGTGEKCTLNNLISKLRDGYDILYLAAHGTVVNGEPRIWLEGEDGKAAITSADELATRIKELQQQPRLVVLASCQSAGKGAGDALQALGPRLAQAGVPAVIAMQGNIGMASVKKFMPVFFGELQKDGQIDRALAVARGTIRDVQDFWMPVLFMRLRSGKIWYVPGFGEQKEFEKWPAIINSIKGNPMQGAQCTPILGAGLYEPVIGSWRDMATHIAEEYRFPLASFYKDSLPQVLQYLMISQDLNTLLSELVKVIRENTLSRFGSELTDDLKSPGADLLALVSFCGAKLREKDPNEQHKVLARLDLPIYITTNYDNLMADALKAEGKKPEVVICPWSDRFQVQSIYDTEPGYIPNPGRPLVYHLLGHFDVPDSLVLTEDDYIDFIIGVNSQDRAKELIPMKVRSALANTAILFLGFQLDDWSFRVLFRSVMRQQGSNLRKKFSHIGIQLDPEETRNLDSKRAHDYLKKYFGSADIDIFWGSSGDFLSELNKQWKPAA